MRKTLRISFIAVIAMLLVTLVSCAPSSIKAATQKMEKKDYKVISEKLPQEAEDEGVVGIIVATKGNIADMLKGDYEMVTATLFKSAKDAKKAMKDAEDTFGKDTVIKQSGKWIVVGTEQGVKDFLK